MIDMTGEQSFLRQAETDGIADFRLGDLMVPRCVEDESVSLHDGLNNQSIRTGARFDDVSGAESNPPEGSVASRVLPRLFRGFERDRNGARRHTNDGTQSEF